MILHRCEQGGVKWLRLRLGIPTASSFHKIVTPTGKLSAQSEGYANELLAEMWLGRPIEMVRTPWMERGNEEEDSAIRAYEMLTDLTTERVGFITNDAGTLGASPDRAVPPSGGVEIKCPKPNTQVARLLTGSIDEEYKPQLQGQMYIAGYEWVDNFYFHPEIPSSNVRVVRDEGYISILAASLDAFVDQLASKRAKLESRFGPFPKIELEPKQDGIGALGITNDDLEEILADHGMTL